MSGRGSGEINADSKRPSTIRSPFTSLDNSLEDSDSDPIFTAKELVMETDEESSIDCDEYGNIYKL